MFTSRGLNCAQTASGYVNEKGKVQTKKKGEKSLNALKPTKHLLQLRQLIPQMQQNLNVEQINCTLNKIWKAILCALAPNAISKGSQPARA